jgi:hypothetical protein
MAASASTTVLDARQPREHLLLGNEGRDMVAADGPPDPRPGGAEVPWWLAFMAAVISIVILVLFFGTRWLIRHRTAAAAR